VRDGQRASQFEGRHVVFLLEDGDVVEADSASYILLGHGICSIRMTDVKDALIASFHDEIAAVISSVYSPDGL
jgi:hypothetical protein